MYKKKSELKVDAARIKNETQPGANSATRVGQFCEDVLDSGYYQWEPDVAYGINERVMYRDTAYRTTHATSVGESPDVIDEVLGRSKWVSNSQAADTLDSVVTRNGVTELPIQAGRYRVDSFDLLNQATHVLVERIGSANGRTYSEIARLPLSVIGSGGEVDPDPVTVEPVFSHGEVFEQVDIDDEVPPAAPSNLVVIRTLGTLNAVASWRDNAGDETAYRVEVSGNGTDFTTLIDLAPNVTVLPLTGLPLNVPSWYRVVANRGLTQSAYSNVYRLELIDYVVTVGLYNLATPPALVSQLLQGGVTVSPGIGNIGITVRLPGGGIPDADDFDAVTLSFLDPQGVPQGWTFPDGGPQEAPFFAYPRPGGGFLHAGPYPIKFELIKQGQVIQRDNFSHTFSPAPSVPIAPADFSVTRNAQNTGLLFNWSDRSNNEDTFTIDIQRPGQSWDFFTSAPIDGTSLTSLISPLPPDGTKFRIWSVNAAGPSTTAAEAIYAGPSLPPLPTPDTLYAPSGTGGIGLNWQFTGAERWVGPTQIERRTGSGGFALIHTTTSGHIYADSSAVIGTLYYYRVRFYNPSTGQIGPYSTEASKIRTS